MNSTCPICKSKAKLFTRLSRSNKQIELCNCHKCDFIFSEKDMSKSLINNKLDEAREVTLGEGGAEVEVEEVLTKREKILLARKKQLQRRRVGNRPIPPVLK